MELRSQSRPALLLGAALCCAAASLLAQTNAPLELPANLPGHWHAFGRSSVQAGPDSVQIRAGYIAAVEKAGDAEISLRLRAPAGASQVELWAGFRFRDRDSRYVFALRGGDNSDLYLARYAPDGGARFLGFAPLEFKPEPGVWYRLRILTLGKRIQIYLNDEALPRLNVEDPDAPWTEGGVVLGGGWLPAEFADLQIEPLTEAAKAAFLALGAKTWTPPAPDREPLRQSRRAAYVPARVSNLGPQRTEISLDGHWLFMPDYQLPQGQQPLDLQYNDSAWHIMEVPQFWTMGMSWLHGETSFNNLRGVSTTKGVADNLYVQELRRLDAYTFDWRKTKAAWYRHYLELPPDLQGRRFELCFDAIAKISSIWVNGIQVATHTGMFGQLKCDITQAVQPGHNVIVAHVISEADAAGRATNKVEGVAVTVEVTSRMLHSLPHGIMQDDAGGIWQPVKLLVSSPALVSDCFIQPDLHGAKIELSLLNSSSQPAPLLVGYSIRSAKDGALLFSCDQAAQPRIPAYETQVLHLQTPRLEPKLWSPAEPNLYKLEVRLTQDNRLLDRYQTRFGFRTFSTNGGRLLLNGQPYWLRGGNPFPNTLQPNNPEVARRFLQLARDGNVRVTRSHIVPFTSTWLDAADEVGMAVSFEGTWPWLMLQGNPPDAGLLQTWKEEFLSLMRQHRNHPSLILWTVNNEMKFYYMDADKPALLKRKWAVLDDMIQAMRHTDPSRPIVPDSGYSRKESLKSFNSTVQPNHYDDGDLDDAHCYFGWYDPTFFHFYDGQFGKRFATAGRPLISQEMSTGYPRSDDGHPTRFYLFKHYTPQAFVGDDAYENADPAIFLSRQAFLTKELAETLRRTGRDSTAGILHFSYFTWLQRAWDPEGMKPLPAYEALQTALQPVLASAELFGRHFYAGAAIQRRVCVLNDADNAQALPPSRLSWEFCYCGQTLNGGSVSLPAIPYYTNQWQDVRFITPANLPAPRINAQLVLKLTVNGRLLSRNSYDVVLADPAWANTPEPQAGEISLLDPEHSQAQALARFSCASVDSLDAARRDIPLVIAAPEQVLTRAQDADKLKDFLSQGGRVLLLHPKALLPRLFPELVKAYVPKHAEIVTMGVPESPVFSQLEPLDLAWFESGERQVPLACSGVYRIDSARPELSALARQLDVHAYLQNTAEAARISGTPLLQISFGKGRLLACEMCCEAGATDPIARRLLRNAISSLANSAP